MSHDHCPTCGGEYRSQCRCRISHRTCANGHHWHRCPECEKSVTGGGSHSGDREQNLCPDCKLVKTLNEGL